MPSTVDLCQDDPIHPSGRAVPVLDAHALRADPLAPALRPALDAATQSTGFVYLDKVFAEHRCDIELDRHMRAFFALSDNDSRKRDVCVAGCGNKYGWMPLYGEPAYQPGTIARVESFDCGRPRRAGDDATARSIWPPIAGFRGATRAVWAALTLAGNALLEALAAHAGLERRFFLERCNTQDQNTMRLLHYPAHVTSTLSNEVGIAAHTDFECITLLYQTAPGLELLDASGHWRDAPAGPEQVVVLFGDMLERFSNGRVRATGHRVRRSNRARYSVVLFFAVNDDVVVAPIPGFAGSRGPARYVATTQRQHTAREVARAEAYRDQSLRS